jgi:hypothetical protein
LKCQTNSSSAHVACRNSQILTLTVVLPTLPPVGQKAGTEADGRALGIVGSGVGSTRGGVKLDRVAKVELAQSALRGAFLSLRQCVPQSPECLSGNVYIPHPTLNRTLCSRHGRWYSDGGKGSQGELHGICCSGLRNDIDPSAGLNRSYDDSSLRVEQR